MNTTSQLYNHLPQLLADGSLDWDADQLRLALLGPAYVFSAEHTRFADIAASEITGTGYVAGGFALAGQTVVRDAGIVKCDADDLLVTGLSATFRSGVLYADKTVGALVRPLVKYILWDDTPADVTLTDGAWPVVWSADGIIRLVVG